MFKLSKLRFAKEQIILHLKYVRHIAMLENKYAIDNVNWYKSMWTIKFQRCRASEGGVYYLIYSDKDRSGFLPKKEETLKDPLTKKYLYASNSCKKDNIFDKQNNVLLTKYFGVQDILISCNDTTSLGQISFGYDGNVYSKITNQDLKYKLDEICTINLLDSQGNKETISISPVTGYIF